MENKQKKQEHRIETIFKDLTDFGNAISIHPQNISYDPFYDTLVFIKSTGTLSSVEKENIK